MKKIFKIFAASCLLASVLASCTGKFEDFNRNPYLPTPEDMVGDGAYIGSLIKNMQQLLVQGQQNSSQMIDQMIGSEYGGYIANINPWGNEGNFYTLNPKLGWKGYPYDTMMPQIYTNYFQITEFSGGTGLIYHWSQILRVFGSYRLNEMYGPIPYSQVKDGEMFVAYDSEKDLFDNMFADLDEAIDALTVIAASGEKTDVIAGYDCVYGGDLTKWVKFANTLKLRMAVRISKADPQLAKTKAEEAVAHSIGVMTLASDSAWSDFNDGMNPYYRAEVTWNKGEFRLSANVSSYLGGYNDPRLAVYANAGTYKADMGIVGVRNGIKQEAGTFATYQTFSSTKIAEEDKLLVMTAAEAYFLRAEGALKRWKMGDTAKNLYEQGVTLSMEERGVTGAAEYLQSEAKPAAYTDPYKSSNSSSAVSTVSPMYSESASDAVNLERILVQKWIASFPNGWERWGDFRRTGFPKMFPVVDNLNTDGVNSSKGMRRLPYSENEKNTNPANVAVAIGLLGGPDTGATDLWWAK